MDPGTWYLALSLWAYNQFVCLFFTFVYDLFLYGCRFQEDGYILCNYVPLLCSWKGGIAITNVLIFGITGFVPRI